MLRGNLKSFMVKEAMDMLDYAEKVETLAEDFNMPEEEFRSLLVNIQTDLEESIGTQIDTYETMMYNWIEDEIKDVLKSKLCRIGL